MLDEEMRYTVYGKPHGVSQEIMVGSLDSLVRWVGELGGIHAVVIEPELPVEWAELVGVLIKSQELEKSNV